MISFARPTTFNAINHKPQHQSNQNGFVENANQKMSQQNDKSFKLFTFNGVMRVCECVIET